MSIKSHLKSENAAKSRTFEVLQTKEDGGKAVFSF